jgi:hypothetical protein
MKRRNNPTLVPRNYEVGDRVIGKRSPIAYRGVYVRAYVTLNNGYRNPAYIVKCDIDGKERSFQHMQKISHEPYLPTTYTLK